MTAVSGVAVGPGAAAVEAYLACLDSADHPAAVGLALGLLDVGASVPARHLVSYLHQTGPDAVLRRRRDVVQFALRAVTPPEAEADQFAAAVGHLVDALAAAIRVGDPQLLLDHTTWQADLLAARDGGRGPLLDAVLAACGTVLADHPRACDHLRWAREMQGRAPC
ncbi:hypothetical protein [Micromonospora carbonacea]|uniref:Uncharacterized protein n=1 Tax=Micromonospora carbonacea TaxID=47853 RepID=A0A1C5AKQ4_9ACTN|nr:hypothetical protein [Micromonospora carbonacea]SCF45797.1 hypothetical protein GA0070563_11441 [Micromonospora carbonacea]